MRDGTGSLGDLWTIYCLPACPIPVLRGWGSTVATNAAASNTYHSSRGCVLGSIPRHKCRPPPRLPGISAELDSAWMASSSSDAFLRAHSGHLAYSQPGPPELLSPSCLPSTCIIPLLPSSPSNHLLASCPGKRQEGSDGLMLSGHGSELSAKLISSSLF